MTNAAKTWCEIHSYISMFFLPLALIYAITGAHSIAAEHEGRGPGPHGPGIRSTAGGPNGGYGRGNAGEWRGPADPGLGEERRERPGAEDGGLIFRLTMLHKAKGGVAGKVLGVAFAAAMVVMYCSGISVCWCNKERRRRMLLTGLAGLIVTALVIALAT